MSSWPKAKRVRGYWNLGRPQVPPLPQWMILVDRETGVSYALTQEGSPGSLTLALTTQLPKRNFAVFGPEDGPFLNGNVRLFVESGTLQSEVIWPSPGKWQARVFCRRANERRLLEVRASADGTLQFVEQDI